MTSPSNNSGWGVPTVARRDIDDIVGMDSDAGRGRADYIPVVTDSTPRLTLIPRSAQPVVPWRNGGGTTREVAVEPPGARAGDAFAWRVSVAQVATDGPFSRFSGIDRTLWLLQGNGMDLDVDGQRVRLDQPFARIDFKGEADVQARLLDGATLDLNLMVDRARVRAQAAIEPLTPGATRSGDTSGTGHDLWLALAGQLELTLGDDKANVLAEGDVAWVASEATHAWRVVARERAVVLIVSLRQA